MKIELTPGEMLTAAIIGVMCQCTNLRDGRKHAHGAEDEDGWAYHIEGACGEAAFAKAIDKYWSGALGDLKADDVGKYQVRTATKDNYRLILYPNDHDDSIFILVVGMAPNFRLAGWMWGRDGKKKEYWTDPGTGRPNYFIPQRKLEKMEDLP